MKNVYIVKRWKCWQVPFGQWLRAWHNAELRKQFRRPAMDYGHTELLSIYQAYTKQVAGSLCATVGFNRVPGEQGVI